MNLQYSDCHIHVALDGVDYKAAAKLHENTPNEDHIRKVLKAYSEANVTFLRDGGDKWGCSRMAKSLAADYGLDYRTPIFAIYKKGSYGSILGVPFETFEEFKSLVQQVKNNDGDFIKIMASGIMDFEEYGKISPCTLSHDELIDMINYSHDRGFSVMIHVNGPNIEPALKAKADSIEHGYYMTEEYLSMMQEAGTVWVPTVTPVANLLFHEGFNHENIRRILDNHNRMLSKAHEMGIPIAPGSDAGSFSVLHAKGSLDEYKYLDDKTDGIALIRDRFQR